MLAHVQDRRRAAQRPIRKIREKLVRKRFDRRIVKFLDRLRSREGDEPCGERFACMARLELSRLIAPYLSTAESELKDVVALHAFRIQGKHVRYAMEIFAGAFDEAFRSELYPQVESLQERLGAINDHVTADAYLVQWHAETDSDGLRKAIEIARRREQGSMEKLQQEFLDWWTPERRARLCACFARYVQWPVQAASSSLERTGS